MTEKRTRAKLNNEPKENSCRTDLLHEQFFISIFSCCKCNFYVFCVCDFCNIQSVNRVLSYWSYRPWYYWSTPVQFMFTQKLLAKISHYTTVKILTTLPNVLSWGKLRGAVLSSFPSSDGNTIWNTLWQKVWVRDTKFCVSLLNFSGYALQFPLECCNGGFSRLVNE